MNVNQLFVARFAKAHLQGLRFEVKIQAQARATAIAPGLAGNNFINLTRRLPRSHHARQGAGLRLLLQRNARMLLLAATADAKMPAARGDAFRTVVQTFFHNGLRKAAFILGDSDFRLLARQGAGDKQRFSIVTRHALSERIQVINRHGYDLTSRNPSLCRVELRHKWRCALKY